MINNWQQNVLKRGAKLSLMSYQPTFKTIDSFSLVTSVTVAAACAHWPWRAIITLCCAVVSLCILE